MQIKLKFLSVISNGDFFGNVIFNRQLNRTMEIHDFYCLFSGTRDLWKYLVFHSKLSTIKDLCCVLNPNIYKYLHIFFSSAHYKNK